MPPTIVGSSRCVDTKFPTDQKHTPVPPRAVWNVSTGPITCGCPPTITSAPPSARSLAHCRCDAVGSLTYSVPQCGHTTSMSACARAYAMAFRTWSSASIETAPFGSASPLRLNVKLSTATRKPSFSYMYTPFGTSVAGASGSRMPTTATPGWRRCQKLSSLPMAGYPASIAWFDAFSTTLKPAFASASPICCGPLNRG